jgi:hypothetical protein
MLHSKLIKFNPFKFSIFITIINRKKNIIALDNEYNEL